MPGPGPGAAGTAGEAGRTQAGRGRSEGQGPPGAESRRALRCRWVEALAKQASSVPGAARGPRRAPDSALRVLPTGLPDCRTATPAGPCGTRCRSAAAATKPARKTLRSGQPGPRAPGRARAPPPREGAAAATESGRGQGSGRSSSARPGSSGRGRARHRRALGTAARLREAGAGRRGGGGATWPGNCPREPGARLRWAPGGQGAGWGGRREPLGLGPAPGRTILRVDYLFSRCKCQHLATLATASIPAHSSHGS